MDPNGWVVAPHSHSRLNAAPRPFSPRASRPAGPLAELPGRRALEAQRSPFRELRAAQRGAACKVDLSDHWDPFAVADAPVEQLRAEWGIPAL
jgi:hypothetical protein